MRSPGAARWACLITQGRAAAEPAIRRAVNVFLADQVSGEERLQWGILAQMATMAMWDFDSWVALSTRHVELARASGALAPLSIALNGRGMVATQCGDFETATSLAAEKDAVNEVTGIRLAATCDLLLAGYRGRPAEAVPLFAANTEDSIARGEGLAVQLASWAAAVLRNGLGRYAEALAAAEPATEETYSPLSTQLVIWPSASSATQIVHELRSSADWAPYTNLYSPGAGRATRPPLACRPGFSTGSEVLAKARS